MSSLLKKLSISIKIHVVKQQWSLFAQFPIESVGSRHELVVNSVHTADADAIKQFRHIGGVYWALAVINYSIYCFYEI